MKHAHERCWLHLFNGWTVSISMRETPPAKCSVAAWPSRLDESPLQDHDWFVFESGVLDVRCYSVEDMRKAVLEVEAALPPK